MMRSSNCVRDLEPNVDPVNEIEVSSQYALGHAGLLSKTENKSSVDLIKTFKDIDRSSSAIDTDLLREFIAEGRFKPGTLCTLASYDMKGRVVPTVNPRLEFFEPGRSPPPINSGSDLKWPVC